jgi:hypothetical protein
MKPDLRKTFDEALTASREISAVFIDLSESFKRGELPASEDLDQIEIAVGEYLAAARALRQTVGE